MSLPKCITYIPTTHEVDILNKTIWTMCFVLCLILLHSLPSSPKQKNRKDVLNFDPEFTKEEPVLTPVNPEVVRTINQDEFAGFSFFNQDYGKLNQHHKSGQKH